MPPAPQQLNSPGPCGFPDGLEFAASPPSPKSEKLSDSGPQEPANLGSMAPAKQKGKPLSRRGHFKSRLGCFNCKRRRVKCTEQRPACSPCCRLGLICSYPSPGASSTGPPRPAMPMLQYEDLRFFHQFLTAAFPNVPMNAQDVWMQAGAMSHNYEHLTHAVLGLGASHLSQHGHVNYTESALQHRVTAMRLANAQLQEVPKTAADADALFATLVCLVTQSSLLPGGMVDYLTMLRGAFLVLNMVLSKFEASIFRHFPVEQSLSMIEGLSSDQPKDLVALAQCRDAIMELEPFCRTQAEIAYHEGLIKSIDNLTISAAESWKSFILVFLMPCAFSNEDFLAFVHPDNHSAHILAMHGFLLDYMLGQFCRPPSDSPKYPGRRSMIVMWANKLASGLPTYHRRYMTWALKFCDYLERHDGRYLLTP